MARPKSYGRKKLKKAVDNYFKSISVKRPLLIEGEPVTNEDGEQMFFDVYLVPPGKASLADFLGIDRRTWLNYSDEERYPELADVTRYANTKIEAWLEQQNSIRDKPQGIQFNLTHNFGWSNRTEISLEKETREALTGATMEEKLAAISAAYAMLPKDDDDA